MTTYRMQSSGLIHTPGMIRWGINGYHFKKDRAKLRRVFTEGWGLPDKVIAALLSGAVPYTVDAEEAVVFTYEERKS
jgi:hypothetical protein